MSSWNGTVLGLKVKPKDKTLGEQFLKCIGVNTKEYMNEEVGRLSEGFTPNVEGKINGKLFGIIPLLEKHYSEYLEQFFGGYEEDDDEFDDEDEDEEDEKAEEDQPDFGLTLDGLYGIVKKVFSPVSLYLAHEDGNDTSDDAYRYEVIYDPSTKYCIIKDCFYSYGEDINVDTDDPISEGTETHLVEFVSEDPNAAVIDWLAQKAKENGFDDLSQKLKTCKSED